MTKNRALYIRVQGKARLDLAEDLAHEYQQGSTIRELAAEIDASYGFVRGLLIDYGQELRPQGGQRKAVVGGVMTL